MCKMSTQASVFDFTPFRGVVAGNRWRRFSLVVVIPSMMCCYLVFETQTINKPQNHIILYLLIYIRNHKHNTILFHENIIKLFHVNLDNMQYFI
jgi:hypothetical protein